MEISFTPAMTCSCNRLISRLRGNDAARLIPIQFNIPTAQLTPQSDFFGINVGINFGNLGMGSMSGFQFTLQS
jgi:hypothetical protein